MLSEPLKPYFNFKLTEAGCDEAGRGCLAGPVFAAAVILPKNFHHPDLTDSKLVSPKKRAVLRTVIEDQAIAYAVEKIDPEEIDQINILQASIKAMHKALSRLQTVPDLILVDGNYFNPYLSIKHQCIIKGDKKYMSIAAASILAKTYRDEYMQSMHEEFPCYCWDTNRGYPTPQHKMAILDNGISPLHRKTFNYNIQTTLW